VDSAARVYPWFLPLWINAAISAPDLLNRRALRIDDIAAEREAAFDWYVAVRNAYVQYRRNQVQDREEEPEEDDDDLYYPDIGNGF
jgi:ABC-type transporter lipoprotein component MlaA